MIFLANLIFNTYKSDDTWLGGNQVAIGSPDYRWLDKSDFNYSNWNKGEPDCGQYCCGIALKKRWGEVGWDDTDCVYNRRKMCQIVLEDEVLSRSDAGTQTRKMSTGTLLSIKLNYLQDQISSLKDTVKKNQKLIKQLDSYLGYIPTILKEMIVIRKHMITTTRALENRVISCPQRKL